MATAGPRETEAVHFFVIEDDPDHQKIAEMTLQAAGISNITIFGTGEEAMDFFDKHDPGSIEDGRFILIDLMLPTISGLEILEKLKKDRRWQDATMVVLSCSTSTEDRERSRQLGADTFLSKPLRIEYIRQIISSPE